MQSAPDNRRTVTAMHPIDDNEAFRAKIIALCATLKPPEVQQVIPAPTEKELRIPKFLRRKKQTREQVRALLDRWDVRKREWASTRKASEKRPSMPLVADNPDQPVKVQVKEPKRAGSVLLATYANMAEFEAKHNKSTYPVKGQPMAFQGYTVILVTAKPWADKEKNAVKRVGPKASAVNVDGVVYDSVLAAFTALALPVSKHQQFRASLKRERSKLFEHNNKSYAFTYDLDFKPPQPAAAKPKGKRK